MERAEYNGTKASSPDKSLHLIPERSARFGFDFRLHAVSETSPSSTFPLTANCVLAISFVYEYVM